MVYNLFCTMMHTVHMQYIPEVTNHGNKKQNPVEKRLIIMLLLNSALVE